MIFADVFVDAREIFGNCSLDVLFSWTTDAIELLANKSVGWDAMTAEMTICACNNLVTLPRDVETPLGVTINDVPALARDKWFLYHANGPGSRPFTTSWYWDDAGERPTIREFPGICKLMAVPQYATDDGKSFRVFGTDLQDRPIYTLNGDGSSSEGFLLVMSAKQPMITDQPIKWIQRIVREPTNGNVKLFAIDPAAFQNNQIIPESFLLGDYEPNETQPNYRRMRVQCKSRIRMRYRRATRAICGMNDYIPLNNKFALVMAMKAIKFYRNNHEQEAQGFEAIAVRLCNEEQETRNAQSSTGPQVNVRDGSHNATLYGMGGNWGNSMGGVDWEGGGGWSG